jgi:hypothetical protein
MEERLDRILSYIQTNSPDRVILLGDVKHNVPQVSWQEKGEIPRFLEKLAEYALLIFFRETMMEGLSFFLKGRRISGCILHAVRFLTGSGTSMGIPGLQLNCWLHLM